MNSIASFIKYQRKQAKLTQEELALKAGVGLRFIRELEQGKMSIQLDKVQVVLDLFGFVLTPSKQRLDPYFIYSNYLNKGVKISLKNKLIKYGILIEEIRSNGEIVSWRFLPNKHAISYNEKPDIKLTEILNNEEIMEIELQ